MKSNTINDQFPVERSKSRLLKIISLAFSLSKFAASISINSLSGKGVGSYQTIDDPFNSNNKLYSFQSFSTGIDSRLRIPVNKNDETSLNPLTILNFDYNTPVDNGPDRLITQQQPLGIDGGRTLHLGTGFIWENRNSEFRPTKRNYIESTIEVGQT